MSRTVDTDPHRSQAESALAERSLRSDYAWYTAANASSVLAGLVSLPLLARALSAHDFGVLGFFEPLAALWTSTLKAGFQHAVLRFYRTDDCLAVHRPSPRLLSTLLWWPQALSGSLTLLCAGGLTLWHLRWPFPHYSFLLALLAWCQAEAWFSLFQNLMGARRHSRSVAGFTIVLRWSVVVSTLFAVLSWSPTATAFQWARALSSLVVVLLLFLLIARTTPPTLGSPDRALLRTATSFSLPMSLSEIATVLHAQIDRIILKGHLQFAELGIYALNSSVAQYPGGLISSGFNSAFAPVANRVYDRGGPSAFTERARDAIRPLAYIVWGTIAVIVVTSRDLLAIVIGSDKSVPALFLWISAIYLLGPLAQALTQGLVLERKSRVLFGTLLASLVVNVGANVILIPILGMWGAVAAAVTSFGVLWGLRLVLTPSTLLPADRVSQLVLPVGAAVAAVVAGLAVDRVLLDPIARVAAGGTSALAAFAVVALGGDRALRQQVRSVLDGLGIALTPKREP